MPLRDKLGKTEDDYGREAEVKALFARLFGEDEAESKEAGCALAGAAYAALLDIAKAQKAIAEDIEYRRARS